MQTLLFVATDMGGGNTLMSVIQNISGTNYKIVCMANEPSLSLWELEGYAPFNCKNNSVEKLYHIVSLINPDLIITGTSIDSTLEHDVWRVSSKLMIPSLALIDGWTKLLERFYDLADHDKYIFPTHLGLINTYAYELLLKACPILPCNIHIIGYPYLQFITEKIKSNRAQINNGQQDHISFFSTPLVSKEAGPGIHSLKMILPSLNKHFNGSSILIKPHPREEIGPWKKWYTQNSKKYPNLKLAHDALTLDILTISKLVIGLPTSVMLEAFFSGIPIITLLFNNCDLAKYPAINKYCKSSVVTTVEQFDDKMDHLFNNDLTLNFFESEAIPESITRIRNLINIIIQQNGNVSGQFK